MFWQREDYLCFGTGSITFVLGKARITFVLTRQGLPLFGNGGLPLFWQGEDWQASTADRCSVQHGFGQDIKVLKERRKENYLTSFKFNFPCLSFPNDISNKKDSKLQLHGPYH